MPPPDWLLDLLNCTITFRILDFFFWIAVAFVAGMIVALKRARN
jgi:hypothetical protein